MTLKEHLVRYPRQRNCGVLLGVPTNPQTMKGERKHWPPLVGEEWERIKRYLSEFETLHKTRNKLGKASRFWLLRAGIIVPLNKFYFKVNHEKLR